MESFDCHWSELLQRASSLEDVHAICSDFCLAHGFDSFHYGARLPTSLVKPTLVFVSGYPIEWWDRYVAEQYIQHDPTVEFCISSHVPLVWNALQRTSTLSPRAKNIMGEASETGLKNGISFSVHSPKGEFAMFSLASNQKAIAENDLRSTIKPFGQLFALYLHEAIQRIHGKQEISAVTAELSAREKECLLWAAEGKTTWEIARILTLGERTVIYHLQNVVEKLQVNNRTHAIVKAIASGAISPQFS